MTHTWSIPNKIVQFVSLAVILEQLEILLPVPFLDFIDVISLRFLREASSKLLNPRILGSRHFWNIYWIPLRCMQLVQVSGHSRGLKLSQYIRDGEVPTAELNLKVILLREQSSNIVQLGKLKSNHLHKYRGSSSLSLSLSLYIHRLLRLFQIYWGNSPSVDIFSFFCSHQIPFRQIQINYEVSSFNRSENYEINSPLPTVLNKLPSKSDRWKIPSIAAVLIIPVRSFAIRRGVKYRSGMITRVRR